MINQDEIFELAQLAEASYADLTQYNDSDWLIAQLQNPAFNGMEFSKTQAEILADNWFVKTHQEDTTNGFSSTLFQSTDPNDGRYVLAFRGTAGFVDIVDADINDIISDGLAIEQIIDLHNEWARIISPDVYSAAKLDVLGAETAS